MGTIEILNEVIKPSSMQKLPIKKMTKSPDDYGYTELQRE